MAVTPQVQGNSSSLISNVMLVICPSAVVIYRCLDVFLQEVDLLELVTTDHEENI